MNDRIGVGERQTDYRVKQEEWGECNQMQSMAPEIAISIIRVRNGFHGFFHGRRRVFVQFGAQL